MKTYTLKSIGKNTDYMTILREMEDGFVVKIVRDLDGYEDVKTDYISKELFDKLLKKAKAQLSGKDIYVQDAYAGSSQSSRRAVRFITEVAWQAHFVKNMFIRPSESELENFKPDFTVYNACKCVNDEWQKDGLNSEVFVIFNIEENVGVIGGTWYGGEMKKGIFSMMNYWLPLENKLPMHCSANVGKDGDTALFFGLSGTGKTTLSTDPHRA